MASLKDLRDRIGSVKNTRKITSAMKMVAAAKLRRAQEQAEASRPYAERMERMLSDLAARSSSDLPLLAGTGQSDTHMIILGTADRGLCGGFNANLVKEARRMIQELQAAGKQVPFPGKLRLCTLLHPCVCYISDRQQFRPSTFIIILKGNYVFDTCFCGSCMGRSTCF